ncbi:MAG: hypothetical protein JWN68_2458 [Nocardioides sp.]|jgi:uncharacterized protein (TIGR03084 family)|uniref:TIGR03084 family metal-binding protein n=1 Tax=Nocardioides sp. TaxID=35761 RepID=UPI002634EF17|nr:TIGR03084 family metal-binding protein [Nocardioides sp.]MCW2834505.1 hypothetical protein [Nocardioides sp.]
MNDVLTTVLTDLTAEGDVLEALVADLDAEAWRTPTPAPGWDVASQVSHLAWTDEVAVLAATDKDGWDAVVLRALADPAGFVDTEALAGAEADPAELLVRWRAARWSLVSTLAAYGAGKMPWFGPPMSATSMATARLMETWAHSLDVHEALGAELAATGRLRHITHLAVRTRDFAFITNSLPAPTEPFRIDLVAPDDDVWTFGPEDAAQTVTGSALDLCLLATQRTHRSATDLNASGPDADRWLDIAQCFAGPPGAGRGAA